jgi:mannuronan synthase
MLVRLAATALLGGYRGRFSPLWPVLLYYNQVLGALVKTYVASRLNQQIWVRQNITAGEPADRDRARRQRRISASIHATKLAAFALVLAFYTGALPVPAAHSFRLVLGDARIAASDAYWIQPALQRAAAGGTLRLPPGHFFLPQDTVAGIGGVEITGAGAARTTLALGTSPGSAIADAPASCGRQDGGCRLDRAGLLASEVSLIVVQSTSRPGTSDAVDRR